MHIKTLRLLTERNADWMCRQNWLEVAKSRYIFCKKTKNCKEFERIRSILFQSQNFLCLDRQVWSTSTDEREREIHKKEQNASGHVFFELLVRGHLAGGSRKHQWRLLQCSGQWHRFHQVSWGDYSFDPDTDRRSDKYQQDSGWKVSQWDHLFRSSFASGPKDIGECQELRVPGSVAIAQHSIVRWHSARSSLLWTAPNDCRRMGSS